MEIRLQEINYRINESLKLLASIQSEEGGFRSYQMNPKLDGPGVWRDEMDNAFLPANVLLPLTRIDNEQARFILNRGFNFLLQNKDQYGLWHYFNDRNAPYFIPYETDTNSILSHIGNSLGKEKISERWFFNQITNQGYFNLWVKPEPIMLLFQPFIHQNVKNNWLKGQSSLAFQYNLVHENDAEFCVSANVLMYLGQSKKSAQVMDRLLTDIVSNNPIQLIYYPNQTIAHYLFARAVFYGKLSRLNEGYDALIGRIEEAYRNEVNVNNRFLNILTANTLMFLGSDHPITQTAIEESWNIFNDIETPFVFYCSNSQTDFNQETQLHNASFGGPALTISFYIEFLNLLRSRFSS